MTAFSVLMTAAALLGFSSSHSYLALCLWAIPYGLGAGSVDASLNNYVALHYASRHMSWLHCMWGRRRFPGALYYGIRFNQQWLLEHGISLYCDSANSFNCHTAAQFADLEKQNIGGLNL